MPFAVHATRALFTRDGIHYQVYNYMHHPIYHDRHPDLWLLTRSCPSHLMWSGRLTVHKSLQQSGRTVTVVSQTTTHLPKFTGVGQRTRPNMAACKTTLSLCLARPSPMGSYRSPRSASLVHLRAPSNFLAQLAANNNATTTTASSSTNPPTPNRTSTPTGSKENMPARLENSSSRAASAAPVDRTADRVTMPTEPAAHGAPTRQYLNSKVTYHVMEGMKIVAKDQ